MNSNEWANFGRDTLENIITTGALVGLGSLVAKAANNTLFNNPSKPEKFDFENKSIDENSDWYGGITYRTVASGGLKVGELRQLPASHFKKESSKVVFVTYAN